MGARTMLFIDGADLSAIGFVMKGSPDLWNGFQVTDQMVELPGIMGAILSAPDGRMPARETTIEGTVLASSVAARLADEDQLNGLLYGRMLEVRQVDRLTRARYGRVQSVLPQPTAPSFLAKGGSVTIRIVFPDPLAYLIGDLAGVIGFGSAPVPMPVGTAPCAPRIVVTNTTGSTVTTRTISVLTAGGDTVASMTLAGSLAPGESLDIDHAEQVITKVTTAGARATGRPFFTAGSWLALRPSDGDPLRGIYPQLVCSSAETCMAIVPRTYF